MAKRNSKRGAHLRGVGNPTVGTKRTAVQLDGSDSDIDPSFDPEDADDADALPTLPPDVVPEEAEPGAKRDAHRQAVLAAQGAAGLQRLDKQAARQVAHSRFHSAPMLPPALARCTPRHAALTPLAPRSLALTPVLRARPVELHAMQCADARAALGPRPPLQSAHSQWD